MIREILKQCSDLSLSEISELRENLADLYREKFDSLYKTVKIYPGEIIADKITEETGYRCYHTKSNAYSRGRGTHVIVIPIAEYSDDLKNKLISKYDEFI